MKSGWVLDNSSLTCWSLSPPVSRFLIRFNSRFFPRAFLVSIPWTCLRIESELRVVLNTFEDGVEPEVCRVLGSLVESLRWVPGLSNGVLSSRSRGSHAESIAS